MRKKLIVLALLSALLLSGCEADSTIPYYRYAENGFYGTVAADEKEYFVYCDEEELRQISIDYPTEAEESTYIGKRIGSIEVSADDRSILKKRIDTILQSFYRMCFTNSSSDCMEPAYEIMTPLLERNVRGSGLFASNFYAARECKFDIDIESVDISGFIPTYLSKNENELLRVFCTIKVMVNSEDTPQLQEIYPSYSCGNMNLVEICLYFINDEDYSLYAIRTASPDPLSTTWYTPHEMIKSIKSNIRLYEIENDPNQLYSGKALIGKVSLDKDQHTAILSSLTQFIKLVFNDSSFSNESLMDCMDSSIRHQYTEYVESVSKSLESSHLAGLVYEELDSVKQYSDGSRDYYETYIRIGYETVVNSSTFDCEYFTLGRTRIPVGSYSATLRVLITTDGQYEIVDWTMTSIVNKTSSLNIK